MSRLALGVGVSLIIAFAVKFPRLALSLVILGLGAWWFFETELGEHLHDHYIQCLWNESYYDCTTWHERN